MGVDCVGRRGLSCDCRGVRLASILTAAVALGGCYTGLDAELGGAESGMPQLPDEGATEDDSGGDTDPEEPPAGACGADALAPTRLWRLSDAQHRNAVADLLGIDEVLEVRTPGVAVDAFVNESELLTVTGPLASQYQAAAADAAAQAGERLADLVPCGTEDLTCAEAFIDDFASRAFRHPLSPQEHDDLVGVYELGADAGFRVGIETVIEAVLQSPSFLYRTELGDGDAAPDDVVELTPFELASALSFLLLDSIPDPPLWESALDGSIADEAVFAEHLERLLSTPEVQENLTRVYLAYVGASRAADTDKSEELFPEFDANLRASAVEETRRFLARLIEDEGTMTELLTSRTTEINGPLAELYGIEGVVGSEFVAVQLPPGERAGVLTQASMMSTRSGPEETSVVHRGLMVQKLLLCVDLPAPPAGVDLDDPDFEGQGQRDMAEHRTSQADCAPCHQIIDPFGLTFEGYDAIGRFRPDVDASAQLPGYGDVRGAVEMLEVLAADEAVAQCLIEEVVTYSLGRRLGAQDECALEDIELEVTDAEGSLLEPFRAVAMHEVFRLRKEPSP